MQIRALAGLTLAALLCACSTVAPPPSTPVSVRVLAINDFHGNLKPPTSGIRIRDPQNPGKTIDLPAGGAEHLASAIRELSAGHPNHIFVAAGDLVGATPLLSSLFRDEPTIESLGLMGLEASAVGNHEFDAGSTELLRQQNGGCHPVRGCKGPRPFAGARFQYLAASTIATATGKTLLPPYVVKRFEGIPVAFIGLTLKETPQIVIPSGVAGLEFRDEALTVNALVPELRRQGIEAIVVLIHEGGTPVGDYNECPGLSGAIVDIVKKFDRAVDLVISGHTHRAYNCRIDGRLVTSADKYGTLVSAIDLTLDRRSGDVIEARADNIIVRADRFPADPAQTALIAAYEKLAAPLAQRVVGRIAAPLTRDESPAGESAIGQLVADSQLAATADAGAQVALMNPGGLRASLVGSGGTLRYEDLFTVQPFNNNLVTLSLSGAQLRQLLEQQWLDQPRPRVLQVSRGFAYSWDSQRPPGQRVLPESLRLNGKAIDPAASYRVTVNSFLADGGDNFKLLKQGREARVGMTDVEALERYVQATGAVAPGPMDRISRLP